MVAAIIVAIMLIPQSLAYALLAGLPAEIGLYSSILPLVFYALFGTSTTLSVGPVAVASLMTASALASVAAQGTADYLSAAVVLAGLSGLILFISGVFRLGFIASFLSHSVVSAFISASAIVIALTQIRHITGARFDDESLFGMFKALTSSGVEVNISTTLIGLSVLTYLWLIRSRGKSLLVYLGVSDKTANLVVKSAPVLAVILTIAVTAIYSLDASGVAIVGEIPQGLPRIGLPIISIELVKTLFVPACLISIIGFVESISVGRTLGAKKRERIDENQELIGLGTANLASSFSGGFPVTGGFSRSVVNFDAGAVTQASSIFAAIFIALASVFLTPYLYSLPKATLAATIIVAVLGLVDLSVIRKTWAYSKSDWLAVILTLSMTLIFGVEIGVSCGVLISLCLHLYRTSRPHIAEVGLVDGTEHFRNVARYKVTTLPDILSLRVDESLFFANASALEEKVLSEIFSRDEISHVVLVFSAVNEVDYSALEVLELLNNQLYEQGICLHLSEVKGPVLDKLRATEFLAHLSGYIYLTQFSAFKDIASRLGESQSVNV
jgi:SulP family sulfate permease|tara:strand:+ start:13394 stop:15058 length:1665 start_codon:yes stop_codon:yes gene_type:complete